MLGTRGLPNRYGGSETCVEEVGSRLVAQGRFVRVFCRPRVTGSRATTYRGMQLVATPSIPVKAVDTLSHSIASLIWLAARSRRRCSVVLHFHGAGNGALLPLASLLRFKTVLTVDGVDWRRAKWSPLERALLRVAARMGAAFATRIVADSREAQALYRELFRVETDYVPYGAPLPVQPHEVTDVTEKHRQRFGKYLIFVGRLVPEKGIDLLLDAHASLESPRPRLLIVGGDLDDRYVRYLVDRAAADVEFAGQVFGPELTPLLYGAIGYVQPSIVEGTSPMLLTAMAHGMQIVASGIPENRETLGETARFFESGNADALAQQLRALATDSNDSQSCGEALRARVHSEYSWDAVTSSYDKIYRDITAG